MRSHNPLPDAEVKALVGLFGPDDARGSMSGPGTTVKFSALQKSVRNTRQLTAPIVRCDRAVKKGHKLAENSLAHARTHRSEIGARTPRRQIGWKSRTWYFPYLGSSSPAG